MDALRDAGDKVRKPSRFRAFVCGTSFPPLANAAASVFLGICTLVLAWFTYQQAVATRESIAEQRNTIARFDEALALFNEGLSIAEANRRTFAAMAATDVAALDLATKTSFRQSEVLQVGGRCLIRGGALAGQYFLDEASGCDYVEVVLRNPGPEARSHVEIVFPSLGQTCRSNTLRIPLQNSKTFVVNVRPCVSTPGTPQTLEFSVKAILDERNVSN